MLKFYIPSFEDNRLNYTQNYLNENGFECCKSPDNADFILLGVNPKKELLSFDKLILAGNVKGYNIIDYTQSEEFKIKNAFLTAEGAVAQAINSSPVSIINSKILIAGYGRIGKALCKYLTPFTGSITVYARKAKDRAEAEYNSYFSINEKGLKDLSKYDFIFNTVPHPLFNEKELQTVNKQSVLFELASFPGGIDIHFAKAYSLNLIIARGLPSKASPKSAGIIIGEEIKKIIPEVFV
ncbi:MAG: hypothetical protein IJT65_08385 [Eubacterium sp.]|nr:hypothetical protein [Eubacterium sp.]